ncbi:MAG: hypothetical protein AB7I18_03885 [Candidatus Berkiella sp.]
MNTGPMRVNEQEWAYAALYCSSEEFAICPVPSWLNTPEETARHEVIRTLRTKNGLPFVTLNHEFIKTEDNLFAMPNVYEIQADPSLEKRGGQGTFTCLLSEKNNDFRTWGVKKTSYNMHNSLASDKLELAAFATSLCLGENYRIIVRPQNNLIHYYHVQLRAPGHCFENVTGFKSAIDYYLFAISLINNLRNLHINNIIHRDIKPSNVMLWQTETDPFGVALIDNDPEQLYRFKNNNDIMYTSWKLGTERYRAPEVTNWRHLEEHAEFASKYAYLYSFKTDIYALGLTFLDRFGVSPRNRRVMMEGCWVGGIMQQTYTLLPRFKALPEKWVELLSPLENIFMKMLANDPEHRPNLSTALCEVIVAMHETFSDETLQAANVKLTLEKCPKDILTLAREDLADLGIALALLEEPLATKPVFIPGFKNVYKPSVQEEYLPFRAVDPEESLVAAMKRCRLL